MKLCLEYPVTRTYSSYSSTKSDKTIKINWKLHTENENKRNEVLEEGLYNNIQSNVSTITIFTNKIHNDAVTFLET